jgi:hypothetical protein
MSGGNIYNKIMSEDDIIQLRYVKFQAKGIECDSRISKISQEQLKEILEVI